MTIEHETLVTIDEAAARLPRVNGKKLHRGAVRRWTITGCHGIVLESTYLGSRQVTSMEAIARFQAEVNRIRDELRKPVAPTRPTRLGGPGRGHKGPKPKVRSGKRRSPAKRRAAKKQARRRLEELGV